MFRQGKDMNRLKIENIEILEPNSEEILGFILNHINKREPLCLFYINVHVYGLIRKNASIREVFASGKVITDGVGIYLAVKILTGRQAERIVTTDLWAVLLEELSRKNRRIFILGGAPGRENEIKKYFKELYPGIVLSGYIDGYTGIDENNMAKMNVSGADVLFTGLGTPRQEEWITGNKDSVNIPVKIAVGSAIDYWSGAGKRAPLILRKSGLEWLYRLFKNPVRFWKRYLLGNLFFLFIVVSQKIKLSSKKRITG